MEWKNHTAITLIGEIETFGDSVYICNRGNLAIYDIETKEGRELLPSNSGLQGAGTQEIEFLSNGNYWVSSSQGKKLFFFNGAEHVLQPIDNNLTNISRLRATDEVLWFSARTDGNLEIYSIENNQLVTHADFPQSISTYALDSDNVLWISRGNDIYSYDDGLLEMSTTVPMGPFFTPTEYYIDNDGTHWLYGSDLSIGQNFILWYQDGKWDRRTVNHTVTFFYEDDINDIAFGTERSIGTLLNGISTELPFEEILADVPNTFLSLRLNHVDKNTGLWFQNFIDYDEPQVFNLHEMELESYAKNTGYLISSPNDIASDKFGNIFCVDRNNVQSYTGSEWVTMNVPTSNPVCVISKFDKNQFTSDLWAFDVFGLCNSIWRAEESGLQEIDILPFPGCSNLSFDESGNLYSACSGIIIKVDTVGLSSIPFQDDLENYSSSHIYYSKQGEIWAIVSDNQSFNFTNELIRFRDGSWRKFSNIDPNATIYESDEVLYFFGKDGVLRYNDEDFSEVIPKSSFGEYDTGVTEDNQGNLWVSTWGSGLYFWDGINLTNYNETNSDILSNFCRELEWAIPNELWISHNNGLTQLTTSNSSATSETALKNDPYLLFPNPTTGQFQIRCSDNLKKKYEVFNSAGLLILTVESSDQVWSTYLERGAYWVRISSSAGSWVKQVVVSGY